MLISHIQLIAIDRCTKFLVMAISEPGKGKKKQRWLHISIPGYGTSFGAQCFLPDPSVYQWDHKSTGSPVPLWLVSWMCNWEGAARSSVWELLQ